MWKTLELACIQMVTLGSVTPKQERTPLLIICQSHSCFPVFFREENLRKYWEKLFSNHRNFTFSTVFRIDRWNRISTPPTPLEQANVSWFNNKKIHLRMALHRFVQKQWRKFVLCPNPCQTVPSCDAKSKTILWSVKFPYALLGFDSRTISLFYSSRCWQWAKTSYPLRSSLNSQLIHPPGQWSTFKSDFFLNQRQ